MAAITWTTVVLFASDLDEVDAAAQTIVLGFVNDEALDPSAFGGETANEYILARVYLAAHFASSGGVAGAPAGGGVGGGLVVTSESGGRLSETYAAPSFDMSNEALALTGYGRAFLALLNGSAARAWMVV